jgi:outer membrane scaffolding protein for murein synthesis (MipA/OmpV family)
MTETSRSRLHFLPAVAAPVLTAVALGTLAAPAAWAQQPAAAGEPAQQMRAGDAQWGVGVGLWFDRQPYRSFDNKVRVLPLLVYVNRYVSILGPTADLNVGSAGPVTFRLRARYAGEGYEAGDSPYLAGMDERKAGFWLGGVANWRGGIANLSAELLADVTGHSNGTRFRLQADRRFPSGAFGFTPRVAAQWVDAGYVDYYYGVQQSEARAGRPAYEGRATTNLELGLRVDYAVAPRQDVFVDMSATRWGSAIADSPLVDRSSAAAVRLGYLYRF